MRTCDALQPLMQPCDMPRRPAQTCDAPLSPLRADDTLPSPLQIHATPPPPALDARLAAAAAYVRQGGTAADIGCDHGKLAVSLVLRGQCNKVIASDLRPAPLEHARALASLHGCGDAVECRLGAGLSVLRAGEVQDIVIAGVSGITICEILDAAGKAFFTAQPELRFVLVPASKHAALRLWLAQHGFSLLHETPVCAAKRYYTVIYAAFTGAARPPAPLECAVGLAAHGPHAAGYLLRTAGDVEKQALGAKSDEQSRLLALAADIRKAAETCKA